MIRATQRGPLFGLLLLLAPAPLVAQESNAELYGNLRYSYNCADDGTEARWASANNASRLGVRGEVSGEAVTAFLHVETGISVDSDPDGRGFTQRFFYGGLRGDFGALTVGRHTTAYKAAGLRGDSFYDTSAISAGGGTPTTGVFAGATFGLSNLTNGFANRALSYTSPDVSGFTGNAAMYLDPDSDHDVGLGLRYQRYGVDVGLQYYASQGADNWAQSGPADDAVRVHGSYRGSDRWTASVSYEHVTSIGEGDQDYLYAAGTVDLTSVLTAAVSVGDVSRGGVANVSGTGVNAGLWYALFPETRIYGLYSGLDRDQGEERRHVVSLGLTQDFSLDR